MFPTKARNSYIIMNKIPETQLEPTQLKRLAAQRQLYSNAKAIHAVQIGLCALGPPILAVLVTFFLLPPVYAACCAIIVAFLDFLWLTPWQQSLKQKATGIQELFDCDVLELPRQELLTSTPLEIETVEKYSLKYKRKAHDDSNLENWYSKEVGRLPLHLGRFICQRSNCRWTAELQRCYANLVLVVLSIVPILTLCLGLIANLTLEKFILAMVVPLMPALSRGLRQYVEHKEYAARLDTLKKYMESLWNKALSNANPDELTRASRELQNEIYNLRRTSPLIFDWLYERPKKEDEKLMNIAAGEMVKKALESLRR